MASLKSMVSIKRKHAAFPNCNCSCAVPDKKALEHVLKRDVRPVRWKNSMPKVILLIFAMTMLVLPQAGAAKSLASIRTGLYSRLCMADNMPGADEMSQEFIHILGTELHNIMNNLPKKEDKKDENNEKENKNLEDFGKRHFCGICRHRK
jgi:hypothetical protein